MTMTRSAIAVEGRHDLLAPMDIHLLSWFFIHSNPITRWTLRMERRVMVQI